MATCFDRWEKDPFFPAAEEVQDSADRMESVYRRWIHERNDPSNPAGDLRRELHTVLDTAKWQLEELDRAVRSNDEALSAGEDTRTRHNQFVEAIGNQISNVENSLKECSPAAPTWVRLDELEREDLALFLSAPLPPLPQQTKPPVGGSKDVDESFVKGERGYGHRRTASANADMETWNILVSNEGEVHLPPPPKTSSFSNIAKVLETTPKINWARNGFRKWKGVDQHQEDEAIPLRNHHISQGLNGCYERSKSYLSSCSDGSYDKQLYGWLGVFRRQLQRSQYQIQYGCSIQTILLAIVVVLLIYGPRVATLLLGHRIASKESPATTA